MDTPYAAPDEEASESQPQPSILLTEKANQVSADVIASQPLGPNESASVDEEQKEQPKDSKTTSVI